ncbi:MAG: PDZ domain-containing protein [Acidobacteria bacterium]|nr:PDZ domain-containing protein [Acidobacteriota bacterium]
MGAYKFWHCCLLALVLPYLAGSGLNPDAQAQSRRVVRDIRVELDGGGFLGIEMEDVTASNMADYKLTNERGVIVRSVVKGSPAETAGLREKDVILEYAGTDVFSADQFRRLVRETPVGRRVDLAVSRDGNRTSLSVKIGRREGSGVITGRLPERGPDTFMFEGPGGRTFGFRLPEGRAFPVVPDFRWFDEGGPTARPRLGVTLQPLTDQMADFLGVPGGKGVLVTSIVEGSPAAGKLKAGDVVVQADGKSVGSPEDLTRIVRGKEEGGKLDLKVIRDKKEVTVSVALTPAATKTPGYKL